MHTHTHNYYYITHHTLSQHRALKLHIDSLYTDTHTSHSYILLSHLHFVYIQTNALLLMHDLINPYKYVEGTPLPHVTSVKYLGVLISSNLSWSSHISKIHAKARCLTGMLYRRFYKHATSTAMLQLYVSLVRPHLEYCSAAWDPFLRTDKHLLERA